MVPSESDGGRVNQRCEVGCNVDQGRESSVLVGDEAVEGRRRVVLGQAGDDVHGTRPRGLAD
jgi:hypothetical protein